MMRDERRCGRKDSARLSSSCGLRRLFALGRPALVNKRRRSGQVVDAVLAMSLGGGVTGQRQWRIESARRERTMSERRHETSKQWLGGPTCRHTRQNRRDLMRSSFVRGVPMQFAMAAAE